MYVRQITVPSLCHARVSFLEQLILQDWQLPAVSWRGRIPSFSEAPVAPKTPLPPGAVASWLSVPVPWRLRGPETTGLDACGASGGWRVPSCRPLCHLQGSPKCWPPGNLSSLLPAAPWVFPIHRLLTPLPLPCQMVPLGCLGPGDEVDNPLCILSFSRMQTLTETWLSFYFSISHQPGWGFRMSVLSSPTRPPTPITCNPSLFFLLENNPPSVDSLTLCNSSLSSFLSPSGMSWWLLPPTSPVQLRCDLGVCVCVCVCVYLYTVKTPAATSDDLNSNFCFACICLCDFGQVPECF